MSDPVVIGGTPADFDLIAYESDTGLFRWRTSGPGISAKKIAGSVTAHGYLVIRIRGRQYRAHRLAWYLTHGEWPADEIDHIDGDPLNNRISNLRVVDRAANSQNRWSAHRDNKSCGLLGATWNKQHKRWQAKIVARKVRYHLGYFDTADEAHAAYLVAKKRLHIGGGRH